MEDAAVVVAVVAAEVAPAPATSTLAGEPITTARLREEASGAEHTVTIVGGPTKTGGFAHLAGYVVPIVGARVRLDLVEAPRYPYSSHDLFSGAPGGTATRWIPNTPTGAWDVAKLPITFVLALPRSRDLGADAMGELEVAGRAWGRPACTSFRAKAGDERVIAAGDDGINAVFFHDDAWPSELVVGALGQTIVHLDGNGKVHDTDIHINGAGFRFSKDGSPAGTQDARSVLTHEIGHALGLGHSNDARATMNASGSGLRWRSLEKDDVDGVCALYPGVATATSTCDGDPCPAGFLCVAGSCQRPKTQSDVCAPCNPEVIGTCEAAGDEARCVDIGSGPTAGRVCGRACAIDSDCGGGFACRPTTEAGDLQCISLDGCKNGASTCTTHADCTTTSECRGGVCVGPPAASTPSDAGAADADASSINEGGPVARGGDCDCRAGSSSFTAIASPWSFAGALVAAFLYLARRRA